ncbi:hypothetical protein WOSG25_091180 [Weissella oryzae SG25]|uniref:Uncharacterized protein n=1 Tax=Weissella oryzae (strain DSM 25784 / JCM 18191 / LMG 30913 / SG25) TaxID=1329250 RepID=A0A069CVB9_WEIOS|nr:hypothetical protein [Weissella oryzae]GAK31419.1 hypothetical protein WOSG25_091180 [Weissella oryzae SG25]
MELTGNEFIELLKNEQYTKKSFTAADTEDIELDDFFAFVTKTLELNQLVSAEMIISGEEPIILRLESSLINLPLRYVNAISKIVINDPARELNLYMIVEHPLVSHSGLRIDLAASVAAYLDDPDSVANKIASFFTEKIKAIQVASEEAEDEKTEDAKTTDE